MTAAPSSADSSAPSSAGALDLFSPVARRWFVEAFQPPTRAQELGWAAIASGEHTLLLAPTGSGKTLAAFLWCLDKLATRPEPPPKRAGVTVLYVSPLRALSYDVERNLRTPLAGLRIAAAHQGLPLPDITVATRTGDTTPKARDEIRRNPPDILITTPESLYLMLTSRSREVLRTVETVIIDEIHTLAATKRGAHFSLSLERLEALTGKPAQRIGLSATQRPLEEVGRFLTGDRPVRIADAGAQRALDLEVVVPVDDMTRMSEELFESSGGVTPPPEARGSLWPAIYPRLLELVKAHRSTLIFVNNRRLAERIAGRLNEMADEDLVRAHHGSVSREQRVEIEERLKGGLLPGLVCTSSLELGIDMGAVDLVIQVESPKSVARGLQRVGRAGHQVDSTSRGRIFPKFRGDLLECAVLTKRMRLGLIEETVVPRNPLDVLAQQIVAMCGVEDWKVADLAEIVRKSYNFAALSDEALESVLGMLAGHYPSDEFADLRPRITWDRETGTLSSRRDATTIALVNAGTIPDRGLYGVFLGVGGPRVGELDEEMVYESRPGETFVLGASSWRIEQITRDQVIVSPAPGEPGKMPFWKGDGVGRPLEFGKAIGEFTRKLESIKSPEAAEALLRNEHDLDKNAAGNLLAYLAEEKEATGALPSDRTVVVERFRDELGDWRVVILTPFGGRVHSPWAQAIEAKLGDRSGFDIQTIWSDDGIAIRFAGGEDLPPDSALFPEPEEVEELVVGRLADTAMFASHFRENAGRALLLPKRRPGARSPLWLQRQRAANLLGVASRYGSFPIILETYRECLRDVFDLPGLIEVLTSIRSRDIRIHHADIDDASPFARSLIFDYVAAYMYEGDAPLAERRAQALTLDRALLRDLLGEGELRELLDPAVLDLVELDLQHLSESYKARNADQLHDLLRALGDISVPEIEARVREPDMAGSWLAELLASRRACEIRIAGEARWISIEEAGRYRDGLGVSPPIGVPETFMAPSTGSLEGLITRYARTHAPFLSSQIADRWRIPDSLVRDTLRGLQAAGKVLQGDFRPGGHEPEWCDPEVLRQLRRRSLARLRREVEPVDAAAFARFELSWQGIGGTRGGSERLREVIGQIEGYALPASTLERDVLPARVPGYEPRLLDELAMMGELAWVGCGSLGKDDGRIFVCRRENVATLAPPPASTEPSSAAQAVLTAFRERGAAFFTELVSATGLPWDEVRPAIWELVWLGLVTNDSFVPVRALVRGGKATGGAGRAPRSGFPADTAGRWSLVARPAAWDAAGAAITQARMLLERYGVVTRETAMTEGVIGGFSAVYPVLRAMEESGKVRRGYFVEGLGAAQFAQPGAVDRLRAARELPDEPVVMTLAATDPANPYGAGVPWPKREHEDGRGPSRTAGARVVFVNGVPTLYIDRGGKGLVTLPAFDDERIRANALDGLVAAIGESAARGGIERIDGIPAVQSRWIDELVAAGFVSGYRGLSLRPARKRA